MRQHNKLAMVLGLAVAATVTSCGGSSTPSTGTSPGTSQGQPAPSGTLREIASPAGMDSGEANLAIGPDGEIYLSWIETTESGEAALKFAVRKSASADEQWSAAQTIAHGDQLFVNAADFPSLLPLGGGAIAAHWATNIPRAEDGYNVDVAFSRDAGKTWSKPVIPHRDHTPTEHGFVSMTPAAGGGVGVMWLDSRKLAKKSAGGSDDVAMMYTTVGVDGKLGPETPIDSRVCECCQPESAPAPNGILTAYRGRTDQEIRDISVVRFDGNKWSEPKNVFPDGWKINACPINGPAIAAHDDHVAVAWFTAANDKPQVKIAFSSDGGNTFGAPVQVDDGNPAGHVSVAALDSGSAVVSWVDRGTQGQMHARQIDPDGTRHASVAIGSASAGSFPRARRSGDSIVFAWTDAAKDQVLVSALDAKK